MAGLHATSQAKAWTREAGLALRELRPHVWPLLGLAIGVAVLYRGTLAWLWNAWTTDPYYGHGLLVPPLALVFLVRARRKVAAEAERELAPSRLLAMLPAAALYALGAWQEEPFYLALSLVAAIAGAFFVLIGPHRARHFVFPTLFLLFAVPIPNLILIGFQLQELATWGTTKVLALFRVPFVQDDFTITAGGVQFQVAPLCSGLSSCLSIVTLGAVIAGFTRTAVWKRVALVAFAVPIALFANVVRISLTVGIGIRWGAAASEGFLHGFADVVLFLLALALVLALRAIVLAWDRRRAAHG